MTTNDTVEGCIIYTQHSKLTLDTLTAHLSYSTHVHSSASINYEWWIVFGERMNEQMTLRIEVLPNKSNTWLPYLNILHYSIHYSIHYVLHYAIHLTINTLRGTLRGTLPENTRYWLSHFSVTSSDDTHYHLVRSKETSCFACLLTCIEYHTNYTSSYSTIQKKLIQLRIHGRSFNCHHF